MRALTMLVTQRGFMRELVQTLILALALGAALAPPARAAESLAAQEQALLHRKIDLRGIEQARGATFVPFKAPEAPLRVVHLWGVTCKPCIEELPVLRRIVQGWATEPRVRFLTLADPPTENERELVKKLYVGEGPALRTTSDALRTALNTGAVPLTLLVDQEGVIRQAFVGTIGARGPELAESINRLLRVLR